VLERHRREQIYDLSGNHDRSGLDEPQAWWWRKWLDPTGEHTEFSGVDCEQATLSDRRNLGALFVPGRQPAVPDDERHQRTDAESRSRDARRKSGGAVSGETFRWWQHRSRRIALRSSSPRVTILLKDTTVASGEWEGMRRDENGCWKSWYHGYYPQGTPQGASFLYWVDSKADSGAFEKVLAATPSATAIWLGAHTHTTPDDTFGGDHTSRRNGARRSSTPRN
jgi:hypothetical protein